MYSYVYFCDLNFYFKKTQMYLLKWKSIPFFQQIFFNEYLPETYVLGPVKVLELCECRRTKTWRRGRRQHATPRGRPAEAAVRTHELYSQNGMEPGSRGHRSKGASKTGQQERRQADCHSKTALGTPHACSPNGTMVFTSDPTHLGWTTHEGNASGKCKMLQSL